jgi:hypothetical protein
MLPNRARKQAALKSGSKTECLHGGERVITFLMQSQDAGARFMDTEDERSVLKE